MTRVREQYVYDEPLGKFGHLSQERLAKSVIQDLVLYEETVDEAGDPLAELPYLGVSVSRPDEFRIGSLVEAMDSRWGYGLALATPGETDPVNMGGVFFKIERNKPNIGPFLRHTKPLVVARPSTYTSHEDYRNQVDELMYSFGKRELEAVMRMVNKMTGSLLLASELRMTDEDEDRLGRLSIPARMRHDAEIKRKKAILRKQSMIEPRVDFALRDNNKSELSKQYPFNQPLRSHEETTGQPEEPIHILECREIVEAAESLVGERTEKDGEIGYVNLHHEIDGQLYYIRLAAEYGRLFGIQILCDNAGAWKSQLFNFDDLDDGRNLVGPFWDQDEILACLRDGEPINDEVYEYNRLIGAANIEADLRNPDSPNNVISVEFKKRPAA